VIAEKGQLHHNHRYRSLLHREYVPHPLGNAPSMTLTEPVIPNRRGVAQILELSPPGAEKCKTQTAGSIQPLYRLVSENDGPVKKYQPATLAERLLRI
jgi:hypothetical protein